MRPRTFAVLGTGVGATALVAAGITYASTAESTPAPTPVHRAARSVHRAAPPVRKSAPAVVPSGGRSVGGEGDEGRDGGGRDYRHGEDGRIYFNERTYSASAEGCITVTGSSSFSVSNDSRKTVEVFRGFSCDDGAPVAAVGPHGDTYGVVTRTDHDHDHGYGYGYGYAFGDDGVVGSFRVVSDDDEW